MAEQKSDANERLRIRLAVVITVVWIVSSVVDGLVSWYDPPREAGYLMVIVAGAVFGDGLIRGNRIAIQVRKNGNGDKTDA